LGTGEKESTCRAPKYEPAFPSPRISTIGT
jgi:hypothetical protein